MAMTDIFTAAAAPARRPSAPTTAPAQAEPLLALWRKTREAYAALSRADDLVDELRTPSAKNARDDAREAYRQACVAFGAQEPATPLGHFIGLLMTDDGDDFADEHPAVVEAIIDRLQPVAQLAPDPTLDLWEKFEAAMPKAHGSAISSRKAMAAPMRSGGRPISARPLPWPAPMGSSWTRAQRQPVASPFGSARY